MDPLSNIPGHATEDHTQSTEIRLILVYTYIILMLRGESSHDDTNFTTAGIAIILGPLQLVITICFGQKSGQATCEHVQSGCPTTNF